MSKEKHAIGSARIMPFENHEDEAKKGKTMKTEQTKSASAKQDEMMIPNNPVGSMTTGMTSPVAAPIAMIFSFNDDLVLRALEGLTQDELWKAPTDRNNAMIWVAGHVVQTRTRLLQLLDEPVDTGWGKLFDRGVPAPTIGEARRYPSRKDIERVMRDVSLRLRAKLASLSDEYLAGPARMQLPGAKTVADELAFFALHDSYHVGQLAYIRKGLGHPGLTG
jgi:uncharacterized damage-inducible protein DinB